MRWVGIESHYFAALFVAPGGGAEAQVRAVSLPGHGDDKPIAAAVAAIDASAAEPVQLFVGAKDHEQMAKLGHQLERVVQVGDWIGPIVIALMGLLRWVHGHVGNWGWSIVLLTVLINLVMAPFRHYSIVNGLKMAKISPEMKAIQERYRKVPLMDPKRQVMQEEIGALYAKHGMSMGSQMAVGCLPLLLTMPFLFAFYRVLSVLVELRGAPFLWITDLAQKDPLFITPVLMGVSMFAMQKMTPSAMDPAQQRIMMLMPLMLAGMFLWAPAGLNLYWLTSNLWSILQQWVEMSLLRPHEARAGAREAQVKDRLFSGTDVEDALSAAAASLGLPRAELRYVVLEPGGGGGRGLSADAGADRGADPGRPGGRGAAAEPRGRAGGVLGRRGCRRARRMSRTSTRGCAPSCARSPRPADSPWSARPTTASRRSSCSCRARAARSSSARTARASRCARSSTCCSGCTARRCARGCCACAARASASGATWRSPRRLAPSRRRCGRPASRGRSSR